MLVLPDLLAVGLRAVLVGTAAGDASAARGHYYAGPGNEFWQYLHASGLTGEYLGPDRDTEILRYGLGLTDIAKGRSASSDSILRTRDYDVAGFVAKIERYRPSLVAFHGKTAARIAAAVMGLPQDIALGRQTWKVAGVAVYVLPSASGSNRDPSRFEGKPSRLAWFLEMAQELGRLDASTPG